MVNSLYPLIDQFGNHFSLKLFDNGDSTFSLAPAGSYASPNNNKVATMTSLDSLFSDDFGGAAVSTTNWDVLDGGLGANANLGSGVLTQAAIGSGTTGITDSVASSGLSVIMGTTSGAERWYLSKQVFAGKEDVLVILSRSQANANNSAFVGLVEVDPTTLVPLLNANFANEFTNRGGCEFGLTATTTAFQAEAVGDSSSAKATGAVGVAGVALNTTQEFLIEIDSRDIIVSNSAIDSVAAKASGASRVSSQCPNDKKLYKLVMRFKNVGVPTATTFLIQRVLVVDNYEQRVQVSTGEGDNIGAKGIPVNIAGGTANVNVAAVAGTAVFADVGLQCRSTTNGLTNTHVVSGASNNATSLKGSAGRLHNGVIVNTTAAAKYVKFFNKASAPTVGTDTPLYTLQIPANGSVNIADVGGPFGLFFATGIAYCIVGAAPDLDNTAVAAGDVIMTTGHA